MRILKMLIAVPMILLFGILRMLANVVSWLYCHAASFVLIPLVICLILAIITTQWFAVAIFGGIIALCFILMHSFIVPDISV